MRTNRIIVIGLAFVIIFMMMPSKAFCDVLDTKTTILISKEGFHYIESEDSISIKGYDGSSGNDISIPSSINGKPVTKIDDEAFESLCELKNIVVPESVTEIGTFSFSNCQGLESITLPSSLKKLGESCFSKCYSLKEIVIPDSVSEIGDSLFDECKSLQKVTFPKDIEMISEKMFMNCKMLKSIDIPSTVTSLESGAFYGCESLENVYIPNGVTKINSYLFRECTSLKSVSLPDNIYSIEADSFYDCISLKEIGIPSNVSSIGGGAFENCKSLEKLNLPSFLSTISNDAFRGCNNLKSVTIGKYTSKIDSTAFIEASSDISIEGVLGSYAYSYAKKNKIKFISIDDESYKVIFEGENKDLVLDGQCLREYNRSGTEITSRVLTKSYSKDEYKNILIDSIIINQDNNEEKGSIYKQIKELPTSFILKIYDSPLKIEYQKIDEFKGNALISDFPNDTVAFYSSDKKSIFTTTAINQNEGLMIHELGHFYDSYFLGLDKENTFVEVNDEFRNIFNSDEKVKLFGSDNKYSLSIKEYFAECFKYYFIYRNTLKNKAPNTFIFIDKILSNYTDDTLYKNHNWDNTELEEKKPEQEQKPTSDKSKYLFGLAFITSLSYMIASKRKIII